MIDPFWALGCLGAGAMVRPWLERVWRRRLWSSELTRWSHLVADGVLMCSHGTMLRSFVLHPPDGSSVGLVALQNNGRHIAETLARFPGWRAHFDVVRLPVDVPQTEGFYPSEGMRFLAGHREASLRREQPYRTEIFLTLVSPPASKMGRRLADWLVTQPEEERDTFEEDLESFHVQVGELEDRLRAALGPRPLRSDGLLSFLRLCATGLSGRVAAPVAPPYYVGHRLLDQDIFGGLTQQVGELECATVTVTGYPSEIEPGVLGFLDEVGYPLRSSLQTSIWSSEDAKKRLKSRISDYAQGLGSVQGMLAKQIQGEDREVQKLFQSRGALADAMEVGDGLAEASRGRDWYGEAAWNVVLFAEDRTVLKGRVKDLSARFHQRGFQTRLETINGMAALQSSWPGHGEQNPRSVILNGEAVAGLSPLSRRWLGQPTHPSDLYPKGSRHLLTARTSASMRFFLNLHRGQVGHAAIFGPTNSGKSVFLATSVLGALQYKGSRVVVLDKGGSAEPVCRLAGGSYHALSVEDSDVRLQPLAHLASHDDRVTAVEWLVLVCEMNGVAVNAEDREALRLALERLSTQPRLMRMQYFVPTLPPGPIRTTLMEYAEGGNYGGLFDGPPEVLSDRLIVYEMGRLLSLRREVAVPAAVLIINEISRMLNGDPLVMVMEEAHSYFGHPELEPFAVRYLREFRKENAALWFVSQSPADPVDSSVPTVFYDSFATQVYAPTPRATSDKLDDAFNALNVDDLARQRIANGVPQKEYIVVQDGRVATIDLALSPEELALLTVSKKDLPAFRAAVAADPEGYYREWIR